jgi:hypothetical protein
MLTNRRILLIALVALLCPLSLAGQGTQCPAYTSSLPLNTGVDPAGALLPGGAPDPRWILLEDPFASTVEPRPADVLINPNAAWATLPQSQWISSQANSSQTTNGNYFYQACFCLRDGFKNASLKLDLRADDIADVFLNNTLAQIKSSTPPAPILQGAASSFSSSHNPDHLVYTGPSFKFGENCLIVRVRNTAGVATGLDLVGSITAAGPGTATDGVLKPECCKKTGSICGMKWSDANHDGVHQSTEPGLQGWTIHLSNGQNAVTDQFGNYCFTNLQPGTYTVTEQNQTGWTQTQPKNPPSYSVSLGAGAVVGGKDFGNCQGKDCLPLCTLKASIGSSCCLGPKKGGSNFYSFLAAVNLGGSQGTCTLKVTSSTTGLVLGSYGPTTLSTGVNSVTGTFSVPPASSPYSLTFACMNGSLPVCSTTVTAPLRDCPRTLNDQESPTTGLQ